MVSIVGFGRPKFGAPSSTKTESPAKAKKSKTCSSCGQEIK